MRKNFSERVIKVFLVLLILIGFIYAEISWNYNTYIAPNVSDASFIEVYNLYSQLKNTPSKEELVAEEVVGADEDIMISKLNGASMPVIDENGFNETAIEHLSVLPNSNLSLTGNEIAAIINSLINDESFYEYLDISEHYETAQKLGLKILETTINTDSLELGTEIDVQIKAVGKINLRNMVDGLEFLIPESVYITLVVDLEYSLGNYQAIDAYLLVNNLGRIKSQDVLNLAGGFVNLEIVEINQKLLNGANDFASILNKAKKYINITPSFSNNSLNLTVNDQSFTSQEFRVLLNDFINDTDAQELMGLNLGEIATIQPNVTLVEFDPNSSEEIRIEVACNLEEVKQQMTSAQRLVTPDNVTMILSIDTVLSGQNIMVTEVDLGIKNIIGDDTIISYILPKIGYDITANELELKLRNDLNEILGKMRVNMKRNLVLGTDSIGLDIT